ncbi:cell wall hydrolase [Novosphingobium sp. Gsoil 351]|uniref:cell wall hydrolase n=1 Tax=Novosphingobium sp. Gsoil 351 TaxID=2675225 RepID=UPI0012B473C5|nr:cell wall hydrolase [Novosphingobium sp. Gsoil 351]QGN53847.1 cell wall hydrolase [Novosphingobium sp. Gsoil 351]
MAALLAVAVLLVAWLPLHRNASAPEATAPGASATPLTALPARAADAPVLAAPTQAPADARAQNLADPFSADKLAAAPSFRFTGTTLDRARAADCLALAALAEAGGDDAGQRAVMQVVLNRVRHPAFARTVCGVVFEGSQRRSGCQFTFTCDGSLDRRYSEAARAGALARAQEALGGRVYAPVGIATHYHTDWVYPWWSPKLLKVAQVQTHLFFRWPGYWGSAAAANIAYRGGEPDVFAAAAPTIASPVVSAEAAAAAKLVPKGSGARVVMRDPSGRANFVTVDPGKGATSAIATARGLCNGQGTCRVYGWSDGSVVPRALPLPAASRAQLQFSYSRDPSGSEIVLYGCREFKGVAPEQCIPRAR